MGEALDKARLAHEAAPALAAADAATRSKAILAAADALKSACAEVLAANAADLARARANDMPAPLQDRLLLDEGRVSSIASAMREVASQPDPLNQVLGGWTLSSGVRLQKVSVPLGVVAMVYEARPNVTADAFALCVRSGNACVLKGGSAAHDSCLAITEACRSGLASAGLPEDALCYVESTDHAETTALMRANGLVDVLIPRGSARLIQATVKNATVPTIETGTGNCHVYLHATADPQMAVDIVVNAKTQRPGVCNAAESLLVDDEAADALLPPVLVALSERHVVLVGDDHACAVAAAAGVAMDPATEEDWGTEYLDLKMSVKCVAGVDEAIAHINRYGTGHSEAIVCQDYAASERFLAGVDAACVYVNASTRFTDGGVFGLGGEIGISTQKLHARGPMGASALTTVKYLLRGDGQVR